MANLAVVSVLQDAPRPEPCDETLIINELIREYLVWHNLRDTLSVFLPGGAVVPCSQTMCLQLSRGGSSMLMAAQLVQLANSRNSMTAMCRKRSYDYQV